MPKRNAPGDVYAEQHLARRIAREREKRGWTYEGLASRMTAAGCPLNQSAIYKIERGDPPRRITVDEMVGYSRVFGIPVSELLLDPDLEVSAELIRRVEEVRTYAAARADAEDKMIQCVRAVWSMTKRVEHGQEALERYLESIVVPSDFWNITQALQNTEKPDWWEDAHGEH